MTNARIERARASGFSLAEVLVAVALLSVILLALFGLVTAGMRRSYGGKKMTEATVLAEHVMERANVEAPQDLMSAAGTDTTATRTWSLTAGAVTPAAESGSTAPVVQRNEWRTLLLRSNLPHPPGSPATLTVTMDARPAGRTFATAATVRITVDVGWAEFGTRRRTVRLQTFNVRSANL